MRRTRRLLLLLIVLIVGGVGFIYNVQRKAQARNAPASPPKLPEGISAHADRWSYLKTDKGRKVVEVSAANYRQLADGNRIELGEVDLKLYHKDGTAFDQVKSAKADYNVMEGVLFSEGDVEITMGIPSDQKTEQSGRLIKVKTSGVRFESSTGRATTDKPASFAFDRGEGQAVGAEYNPQTRELQMKNDVKLIWRGEDHAAKPMEVESGSLSYKEGESKIILLPWSKFKRDTLSMEAAGSVVSLNKGVIQLVEAQAAHGMDVMPSRQLQYAADNLRMNFDDKGTVQAIVGDKNAKLVSIAKTAVTTVTSNRVDLFFDPTAGDSVLKEALATGNSVVEAKPVPQPNTPMPDTRVLKSDAVALNMRPGGEEIDHLETHSPATLEFLPNRVGQKHRTLTGERMTVQYGPENQMQSFRTFQATTRTDAAPQPKGKPPLPPSLTWSKELTADFDPKTGTLEKLEQWDDFRYEEGDRKAVAQRASLDAPRDLITLTGAARAWDPAGATSADRIVTNQKTGDFEAVGNVNSTRLPDKKKDVQQQTGLLAGDDPVQAKALRMISNENRQHIEYIGDAYLWQGANRIRGDKVVIERKTGKLTATGSVTSQLLDKQEDKKAARTFTIVKAPELAYSDTDRVAHYKGGATMNRGNMVVTAKEIKAFLKNGNADSSLDKAFADGAVKVVQMTPKRTRTGTSEHAEHYADEGKTILSGGVAQLVDTVDGITRGRQLTYWTDNDRLLVEGAKDKPVESQIRKK